MLVSPCTKLLLDRPYRSDGFLLIASGEGSRLHGKATALGAEAKAGSPSGLIQGKQE